MADFDNKNSFDEEAINTFIYSGLSDTSINCISTIQDLTNKIISETEQFTGDSVEISYKLESLLDREIFEPFTVQSAFDKAQQQLAATYNELAKTSGEFPSQKMLLIRASIGELEESAVHYFIKHIGKQIVGVDLPRQLTIVKSELSKLGNPVGSSRFIYKAYLAFKKELDELVEGQIEEIRLRQNLGFSNQGENKPLKEKLRHKKRTGRPAKRKITGITSDSLVEIYLRLESSNFELPTRDNIAAELGITGTTVSNYLDQVGIDGMDGLKLKAEEVKKEKKEKKF